MGNIIIFYIKSNKWRSFGMIAKLADSYLTTREEFELTSGYQPIDSLFYVKKGSFLYKTENGEFIAKSGDFIIFNKSTRMQRTVLSSLEMLYIKFYPSKGGLYEISLSAPIKAEGRIREDLDFIERLSITRTESSLKLRNHYFNDLLITLLDKPSVPLAITSSPVETAIDKAITYIEKNIKQKLSVCDIAQAVGSSVSSLEGKFVSITGKSVYDYVINARLRLALELLVTTSLSVTAIAEKCGYDNVFYFCNAFKKAVGCTPGQYRKKTPTEKQ
jgi:AraC-like DNA-binding protein